ncbi:MAG TPA: AmmeMemoRadiSam system protein A [Steroidobacteraceae bacterium]|nr:AmmeMemoRadiSam system protein A [Steroidobacteraceae bacterium]
MATLSEEDRAELLTLARYSISTRLAGAWTHDPPPSSGSTALAQPRSSFVTLRMEAELRGCCGSLDAARPLHADVWRNAVAAAFGDPRFEPITEREWAACRLHVSVLTMPEPLPVESEAELRGVLRPHVDGLVLELPRSVQTDAGWVRAGRSTFLPAVWEQLPDVDSFLHHLKRKAGWPADFWSSEIRVSRYVAEEFGE